MPSIKIQLRPRECPCCGADKHESLWSYEHETRTQTKNWIFHVNNGICSDCGFIYTSPVADADNLIDYYADSFTKFTGQELDFDVEKRINLIQRYISGAELTFVEIGANSITAFHSKLGRLFKNILTVEPNQSAESEFRSLSQIASVNADFLTHYFVLEHIPDISEFLNHCSKILKSDGIMICEVPSLELYKQYISPLILFEHVNHFTPVTLARIAARVGFELLHWSHPECSRPFGFVAVFKKNPGLHVDYASEYSRNKSLFNAGLAKANEFFQGLQKGRDLMKQFEKTGELLLIWAANETTARLLEDQTVPANVLIVDSDPRKKNYLGPDIKVFLPSEKKEWIVKAEQLIICTQLHAKAIIDSLRENMNKTFAEDKTLIVDIL